MGLDICIAVAFFCRSPAFLPVMHYLLLSGRWSYNLWHVSLSPPSPSLEMLVTPARSDVRQYLCPQHICPSKRVFCANPLVVGAHSVSLRCPFLSLTCRGIVGSRPLCRTLSGVLVVNSVGLKLIRNVANLFFLGLVQYNPLLLLTVVSLWIGFRLFPQ